MDCLERDAPINVMVQLLFVARNPPGLRTLSRVVRLQHRGAEMEILPSGGAFSLPRTGTLRASYDVIPDRTRLEVLTLSLSGCPGADPPGGEADRLDAQSRILQPLIAELEADETHWHLLPGPVDRTGERRLARRAVDLLRRPLWSARPGAGLTEHGLVRNDLLLTLSGKAGHNGRAHIRAKSGDAPLADASDISVPANDLPALPRLRRDRLSAVLDALADKAPAASRHRLTLQIGTACAVVMSQQASA